MKVIGITGGVGAGKSQILSYLKEHYNCRIIMADLVAHKVKEPNGECYQPLISLLGQDILEKDGTIDKKKMAERIFADASLLEQVNRMIHPAVKNYILKQIRMERELKQLDFLFLEAALLIEEHYDEITDEMWYIYTQEEIRKKRLKETRNYSDEKTEAIMQKQLSEKEFRAHCDFVIDNSYSLEESYGQIRKKLEEYL